MKLSRDTFFVTVVMEGLGFVNAGSNIQAVTASQINQGVDLCLQLAGKAKFEPHHYALMQALHDRDFTVGIPGFFLDRTFGQTARQALENYRLRAQAELAS